MDLPLSYLGEKICVEEVVAENDFENTNESYSQDWKRLLAKIEPGDELRRISPPADSIRMEGIALVRNGRVISTLIESVT